MPDLPSLDSHYLITRFKIKPDKALGQNFLVDEDILDQIITISKLDNSHSVLEIGSGLGNLTRYLCQVAKKVVAVELDGRFMPVLKEVLSPFNNFSLVQGDILKVNPSDLQLEKDYLVIANIPYNITSALIRHLLEARPSPRKLFLTVQKEIAERICSPNKLSLLAISVLVYGKPAIRMEIPARAFLPAPKVDSALVEIDVFSKPEISEDLLEIFFRMVRAGFSQKRKTLRNSLSAGLSMNKVDAEKLLANSGIKSDRRAETLSIAEWKGLAVNYRG